MIVGVTGLYTGSEVEPGYAILGCLKQSHDPQLKLVGLSSSPVFGCAYRKDLTDRTYLVPTLSRDNIELYLKRIKEIKSKKGLDVLIPATGEETSALVPYTRELKSLGILTLLPSVRAMNAASDRDMIARFQNRGAKTMPSISSGEPGPSGGHPIAMAFPLVKSPVSIPFPHPQIKGDYYSAAILTDRGKKVAAIAVVHQLLVSKGGSTWMGKIVAVDAIQDMAGNLAAYLKWTGPLTINLYVDEKGRIFIMSIHPGLPDWINFIADAGLNFPAMILDIIRGRPLSPAPAMATDGFFIRMSVDMVTDMSDFGAFSLKGVLPDE